LPRIGNSSSDEGVNLCEPMMNTNHPDDELLAAFAGADPDATGDPAVSEHLASCDRCTATIAELRSLAMALGELPDLAPHRPLRFLPPVGEPRPGFVDRLAGVVRGIFAPALTAGAALALVGAVGTFGPSVLPSAQSGGAAGQPGEAALNAEESAAPAAAEDDTRTTAEASTDVGAESDGFTVTGMSPEPTPVVLGKSPASPSDAGDGADLSQEPIAPVDRPIWPMLLFSGIALIVLMAMLRWILTPRAG
jgi:hypothetical protein